MFEQRRVHAEWWLQCQRRLLGEHTGVLGERMRAVHGELECVLHGYYAVLQFGEQLVHGVHGELQLRGHVRLPERVAVLFGGWLVQCELQRR